MIEDGLASNPPLQPVDSDPAAPQAAIWRLPRRSMRFWVLTIGFLVPTAFGWIRMIYSILNWYWLSFAGINPGPLYLAISGGVWGLAGLAGLAWLWGRFSGHRLVVSGLALFFALTYWIDRLVVRALASGQAGESVGSLANGSTPASSSLGGNALFAVIFTLICLVFVLSVLRPWEEWRVFSRK